MYIMEKIKTNITNVTKDGIVKGKIANAITSAAKNHIVATTDDLYDTNLSEYQDKINQNIFETLSDAAKEDTLVAGISNIREDISEIELDTSDLAKEETLTTGVSNIINDVNSQANTVTSTINSNTENIIGTVNGQANAVIDTVNSQTGNVINNINTSTTNVVSGQAQGIQDNINAKTTDILNTVNAQAQAISTNVVNQTTQIISNNNQQTSAITSTVNQQAQSTNNIINTKTGDIINTVNTQAQSLANDIVNLDDNLDSGVTRIFDAINLIKEELQGQNSAITLTYLYDTLGDLSTLLDEINGEEMPVEFATDYARQGENSGATNTAILDAVESTSQSVLGAVQSVISAHVIRNRNIDGYVFIDGYEATYGDIINRTDLLVEINDDNTKVISRQNAYNSYSNLEVVVFSKLENLSSANAFRYCSNLKSFYAPKLYTYGNSEASSTNNYIWGNCPKLEELRIPMARTYRMVGTNNVAFVECPNLILLEIGANFTGNYSLNSWSPINALNAYSSSLVHEGETFANNLEKLLYNIREHIASNLPDRTGLSSLTITFGGGIKAAILADQPTADAFTNKNWIIA